MADNDNLLVRPEGRPMRLYVFKSQAKNGLRAFAGDLKGSKLPDQYGPWRAVGAVAPDKDPPHALPRARIEKSIRDQGFELWRLLPKKK
jgi:hypothetical protein